MYLKTESYLGGKPILFGQTASRTPYSVAVKASDILPDANGKRLVPEGSFVVSIKGEIRFLPRARVVGNLNSASPNITVASPCSFFKPGDDIFLYFGAGIQFSGTPVAGDVVFLNIGGLYQEITATEGMTLLQLCQAIASLNFPGYGLGVSNVGRVNIQGTDHFAVTVGLKTQSINSTLLGYTVPDKTSRYKDFSRVMTIDSISSPNNQGNRVITLTQNSFFTTTLPGQVIGVPVDKFIGIYPEPLDFTKEPVKHIAPIYHADGVYEKNLPYIDGSIKLELPGLNIEKRFYANT